MIWLQLFYVYLKIGIFGFGGASVRCFRHWRRSPLQHPVLSAFLAWHMPHLARRIGT